MEGPPHKRIYTMGVEKHDINKSKKEEYIKNKDYQNLCISFGIGNSKKEGEQKAAKMSLIINGILNKDQYSQSDIYYPNFSELFKDEKSEASNDFEDNSNINSDSEETDSDY